MYIYISCVNIALKSMNNLNFSGYSKAQHRVVSLQSVGTDRTRSPWGTQIIVFMYTCTSVFE